VPVHLVEVLVGQLLVVKGQRLAAAPPVPAKIRNTMQVFARNNASAPRRVTGNATEDTRETLEAGRSCLKYACVVSTNLLYAASTVSALVLIISSRHL